MRLIDADKLLKGIEESIKTLETERGEERIKIALLNCLAVVMEAVKRMETAYDIDKVVEDLNCDRCESCSLLEVCAGSKCCTECHKKIIEIVKKGGVDNTDTSWNGGVFDDVCEWIKYDYRTICPRNHDIDNPYWRIPDNMDKLKYCPYCGKKIKVVE